MREYKGCLEIVEISQYFKNCDVIARKGLVKWKVFTEDKNDNKKLIEILGKDDENYLDYRNIINPTVFPDDESTMKNVIKTQNCVRIFPHDSDTSNFNNN